MLSKAKFAVHNDNGRIKVHGCGGELKKLPSGDAQRTWFPEMVSRLRSNWHDGISMPDLISPRDELDGMLQWIRSSRNIRTPIITCRRCGMTARAAAPHVCVRALILALPPIRNRLYGRSPRAGKGMGRIPSASPADGREKSWKKCRELVYIEGWRLDPPQP